MNQQSIITDYIKKYSFFGVIAFGVIALPVYKLAEKQFFEAFLYSYILFFFVTLLSFWLVIRQVDKKGTGTLLNNFFLSMAMKMLISMLYFFFMLKGFKGYELEFALIFFVSYFLHTGFEVYYILTNLREI